MGYSLGYFSEIGLFLKKAITRKIFVGISSNFLHSIRISIYLYSCFNSIKFSIFTTSIISNDNIIVVVISSFLSSSTSRIKTSS